MVNILRKKEKKTTNGRKPRKKAQPGKRGGQARKVLFTATIDKTAIFSVKQAT